MALRPTRASRARAATVNCRSAIGDPSERPARRSRAARSFSAVACMRRSCGFAAVIFGTSFSCRGMIGKDALALGGASLGKSEARPIETFIGDESEITVKARLPDRSMPLGDGEVGAAHAGALGAPQRVRTALVSHAGGGLGAIDTISPVADTEPHAALLDEEIDISCEFAITGTAAETRPRRQHAPRLAAETRRGEQFLKRGSSLIERLCVDEFAEIEICPDIGAVGHDAADVPEMMLQGVKAGAVAFTDKAGEGLAALVCGQTPGRPIVVARHVDEGRESLVQADDERAAGHDLRCATIDDAAPGHGEPQFRSASLSTQGF